METQCDAKADLCGLWVCAVGIHSRSDACGGDDRRVVAVVSCDCEQVLRCEENTKAFHCVTFLGREIVAHGDVVEFEVTAVLQEEAADDASASLHVGIVGVGGAEHVVCTAALQPHTVFSHVEDLVTESATPEHVHIPVLVTEVVGPVEEMLGGSVADVALP